MSISNTESRIEYLNAIRSNLSQLKALSELQANRLVNIVFSNRYDLSNKRDIAELLDAIDNEVEKSLKPESILNVENVIGMVVLLGIGHELSSSMFKVGGDIANYMNFGNQLTSSYVNRVAEDGLRLSQRIWNTNDIQSIYKEVYSSIRNGDTMFSLAQNIEKQVASGIPYSSIKRVAHNEMVYAYTNAKYDIAKKEMEDYGFNTWVRIKLSPSHAVYDICDELEGEYPLDQAPRPPFHVGCNCDYETYIKRE